MTILGNHSKLFLATAMFAMAMSATSVAQATPAHLTAASTSANVKLKWERDPTHTEQILITEFGEINCDLFAAEGTIPKTTGITEATNVLYESSYFGNGKCEAFGLEAEVRFNGCKYILDLGTFVEPGVSVGTKDLVCPVGKSVQIVTPTCTVTIPPQSGLGPTRYTDGGGTPKDITEDNQEEGISYSGAGATCSGSFANGVYDGRLTLRAFEDVANGAQVALTITST